MNAIAAWMIAIGLMSLGWSVEKAAETMATSQCGITGEKK